MRVAFCDSSALIKLVVEEPESAALRGSLRGYDVLAASVLATVEVPHAVLRRDPELGARAHQTLRSFMMVALDQGVIHRAASLAPSGLRTLEAIQLACALTLSDLDPVLVAYDGRMLKAAETAGLRTLSPK